MRAPLLVALCLLLPLAPVAHADPGDVDAPPTTTWSRPPTQLTDGTFEGNLSTRDVGADDLRDAYRVVHAAGKGVRVTVWSADSAGFRVSSPHLVFSMPHNAYPLFDRNGTGVYATGVYAGPGAADFTVELIERVPRLDYTVAVETLDIRDLEVTSLRVVQLSRLSPDCLAGCPLEERIRVEMTVRALGAGPYEGTLSIFVPEGPVSIARADIVLKPGSEVTLVGEWRPVAAGDLHIHGVASRGNDQNLHNNMMATRYAAYVGGFSGVAVA